MRRSRDDDWSRTTGTPVPHSKKLSLVVLSTPLGDIPNALLAYFDAIVEVSGFRSAPETAVDAAGAAAR